ncbi:PEP-CTERM sorting domain-containing protein [Cerasicoccus arenae]|uniref:PEP-CTERM protein-sorting domain-containing protein n=1 Tax=Cerasicoccus arenae TaxID=424488 RepID=A0A8J3D9Z7_9BACT|nr:PEP-CTERM sorting domain-containing protein [Cerasicoccus arenae]MBK1859362.1 PEP-CTERM sorting domain-containing protein [Cerasicoccus arenae]GHB93326.1 hypothetical protein GCM10007047_05870 [Cerasicoccus arenae]
MQFLRIRRAGQFSVIALTATLAPTTFGLIQIDNYLVDGVPSAVDLNEPFMPYAASDNISANGISNAELVDQSTTAAIGGIRNLRVSTVTGSGGYLGDMASSAAVLGYGANPGLQLSVSKETLANDTYHSSAAIRYGSTGFTTGLNLDLIAFLGGQALSAGYFNLDVGEFTATGAVTGEVRIGLTLWSYPTGGPIINEESVKTIANTNISAINWNFEDFSPSILGDVDQMQLTLYSGNVGDGFTDIHLSATSFTIVPEPSTYALIFGGAVFFFLIHRKLKYSRS